MKKLIKMSLLVMLLIPLKINAYCKLEDKARYNSLASNIVTSYEYKENNGDVSFDITIHNVHNELIVVDTKTNKRYENNLNGLSNLVISNLKDGTNYSFKVYAKSGECSYRVFNTLYVSTPKYNKYYSDDVCNGASEYSLCQKWAEIGSMSYEEFKRNVEEYKKPKEEIIIAEEEKKNWLYIISDFWANYYLYIIIVAVIILGIIIFFKNKKNKYEF